MTKKTQNSNNAETPSLNIAGVSGSTDLNHKCSIEEPNLFLFFFCAVRKY